MPQPVDRLTSSVVILVALAVAGFFIYPHTEYFGLAAEYRQLLGFADSKNAEVASAHIRYAAAADEKIIIPQTVLWDVPFSSQAPFENWSQPWQDACEEASVLMAVAWARGAELTPSFAAEEILQQVQFEEKVLGYHRDTNLKDTARLLKDFYRYENFDLRYDGVTPENIKKEVASGNLVIVPLAGEVIENPYFTSPPHYHMVVVRGYDDKTREFIVNEPGTKHGNGLRYRYDNLMEAIHDWTGSAATILDGEKAMIVVRPVKKYEVRYNTF